MSKYKNYKTVTIYNILLPLYGAGLEQVGQKIPLLSIGVLTQANSLADFQKLENQAPSYLMAKH